MPEIYSISVQKASLQNTAVILPVYNTGHHLKALLPELLTYFPARQIIAVNDGSSDDSTAICNHFGVNLIDFDHNQGKGAALLAGMHKALETGSLFALTIDSDEQHPPAHIHDFIKKQNDTLAGVVLGKRDFNPRFMPLLRVFTNKLTSLIVSLTARQSIPDSQSGYRLYYLKPLENMTFKSKRYQFESEILLKLSKAGIKFTNIPIATVYGNETSHISPLRDIGNFIRLIITHWLKA